MTPTFYHRPGPRRDGFTEEFYFGGIDDLLGGLFGRAAEGRGIRLRGADREGRNLVFDLLLSVREAIQGARVEVPTLEGRVTLSIPPGTDSGTRLRLSGKGVPDPRGGRPGDLRCAHRLGRHC